MKDAVQAKVNAERVRIAADSALVITGDGVRLEALDLDGALVIAASPGAPTWATRPDCCRVASNAYDPVTHVCAPSDS